MPQKGIAIGSSASGDGQHAGGDVALGQNDPLAMVLRYAAPLAPGWSPAGATVGALTASPPMLGAERVADAFPRQRLLIADGDAADAAALGDPGGWRSLVDRNDPPRDLAVRFIVEYAKIVLVGIANWIKRLRLGQGYQHE